MILRAVLLALAGVCLAASYRFASHGIPVRDYLCIALACGAATVAALLVGGAFWSWRRDRKPTNTL